MAYYISTSVNLSFADAIDAVERALAAEGFGIISRIDIQEALKTKIGVDFRPYMILGACNPKLAHQALLLDDKVGTMLPCNLVVQAREGQEVEVAAIDPVASMQAIDNPELKEAAGQVRERLTQVIQSLAARAAVGS